MKRAYTLQEVVDAGWAPSVHYLVVRLRRGDISGRKVGRDWRMSDDDVRAWVDSIANAPAPKVDQRFGGLSIASARRRAS